MRLKPTRIVAPPKRRGGMAGGRGNHALYYLCDDGNWYTQRELAAMIPMSPGGFGLRLRRYKWWHPDILKPPQRGSALDVIQDSKADGNWAALSTKSRSYNLARIPVGTFEREMEGV